jgi:leucyl aminopeptidase
MSLEFVLSQDRPRAAETAAVVVGLYEDRIMTSAAAELDEASGGHIKRLVDSEDISGKAGKVSILHRLDGIAAPRVVIVGLGDRRKFDAFTYHKALSAALRAVRETPADSVLLAVADLEVQGRDREWALRQAAQVAAAEVYQYVATRKPRPIALRRVLLSGRAGDEAALARASALNAGVEFAKELGNLPPNICTPAYMAERVQAVAGELADVECDILDENRMHELGMGSLLAVARGSANRPRLIVLHYRGGGEAKPYALVGKGITFDSGGISLKPGPGMDEMKYDMCGAATVLGAFVSVAKARLPINLSVVVAAVENMPDGASYRPGDVLTSMSGKTIEVLNTDAEGRLILCDALTYAQRFEPQVMIDCATLTGACVVALGKHPHGLFTADDALAQALLECGDAALDRAWRMPLWPDYQEQLESVVADMANIGGKWAGAITAACFLWRFTEGQRWAHLDIAGTAWEEGRKGLANGRPVPLLVEFLTRQSQAG